MRQGVSTWSFLAVVAVVSVALCSHFAYGQATDGNIVGTVVDSQGAAVVGAEVSAVNVATNTTATTKTNESGQYRLDHLLVGSYRISAKMTGFKTIIELSEVRLNTTGTVNLTLSAGAVSETVEVSGAAPIIDTTTAQLQVTYEEKQLADLPTTGLGVSSLTGQNLGVLNLSLLEAGVASSGGLGAGTGPSVGGQRPRDNNYTIEGIDNNDKGVTGPLVYVPADAVANFTVLQNQFNSDFGHSNGGQFNIVVRSGSNSFHGVAYEYFQNRNLNAIDQDVVNSTAPGHNPKNPRFDNNRFGGQVGGPIIKDKLFFFVNYEYGVQGLAAVPGAPILAPTSAGYASLLALPGVSAANVGALQKYAVAPTATTSLCEGSSQNPCPAANSIAVGILPVSAPNYTDFKALITSMDYNLSARDQIRGRYIYNQNNGLDIGAQLPAFFTPLVQPYHLVNLSEYHTFSPAIGNEFRLGFTRTAFNITVNSLRFLPTLDAFPNITITELGGLNVGPDTNGPQYSVQNLYQAIDNVSWVKGNHTLKLGIEGSKSISPQKDIQRPRGDYTYQTLLDFAQDLVPGFGQRGLGSAGYSGDQSSIYWYANDIWKVRPNLSLTYGLRYEYTGTTVGMKQLGLNSVADVPGLITFTAPRAPKNDFMPRVGFAYSPGKSGDTSIRGGFGLGYDVMYDNIGSLARPPQIGQTVNCPNAACQNPFLANGGIPPGNVSGIQTLTSAQAIAATSSYLPNNLKYPRALSWNLGVQRVFAKNYTADIRYVGTRGEDLDVQNILNFVAGAKNAPGYFLPTYIQPTSQATVNSLGTAWAQCDPASIQTVNGLAVCNGLQTSTNGASKSGDIPGTLAYGYDDVGTGPGGFYDPRYLNAGFVNPITAFMPWGSSTYHGLQTQLNRRFSNGLQFQAAYTFSHMIDNSTADFHSTDISPRRPQDFQDLAAERANSILDHRHRITIATIYDAPWFQHDSSWVKRNVLGNYEIAPVFTWESGQWGTVQSGVDANLNADAAPDRAILNPSGVRRTGSDVIGLVATAGPNAGNIVAYQAVNPNAQYIVAQMGTLANSSRNTFTTAPINNWDITVAKHLYLTERFHFDVLMQALNAFNHPEFATGSVNQALPISDVGSARNYFIPNQPNFGASKLSFPSNARFLQLALRLSF
jgi:Carboxypeptidase regulatory-like domain